MDNAYYAPVSPSGIGGWVPSTRYPLMSSGMACIPNTQYYIEPLYPMLCAHGTLTTLHGMGIIDYFNWGDLIGFVTWAAGALLTGNPFV